MGLNQGWIFFKMGATVRGSMESKVYARENKNDGPWNLRRKEGTMRDSKKHGRTNGPQIMLESKKCTDEVRGSKLEKGNG